jgi:hypothetical protein
MTTIITPTTATRVGVSGYGYGPSTYAFGFDLQGFYVSGIVRKDGNEWYAYVIGGSGQVMVTPNHSRGISLFPNTSLYTSTGNHRTRALAIEAAVQYSRVALYTLVEADHETALQHEAIAQEMTDDLQETVDALGAEPAARECCSAATAQEGRNGCCNCADAADEDTERFLVTADHSTSPSTWGVIDTQTETIHTTGLEISDAETLADHLNNGEEIAPQEAAPTRMVRATTENAPHLTALLATARQARDDEPVRDFTSTPIRQAQEAAQRGAIATVANLVEEAADTLSGYTDMVHEANSAVEAAARSGNFRAMEQANHFEAGVLADRSWAIATHAGLRVILRDLQANA